MAGSDKVKVPLIGETNKSTLFIAGLAGVVALGWAWYKQKKSAEATAAIGAAGTAGVSQAGYAYGYGTAYNNSGFAYGYGYAAMANELYGQEAYAYGYTEGANSTNPANTSGAITTNAQWSQEAVTTLTNQGYDGTTVLAALGIYLTGGSLSAAQVTIVQAAIGAEGYPPVAGAGGYPPAMNTAGSHGTGGTTPASGNGNVIVPNLIGRTDLSYAVSILNAAGLQGTSSAASQKAAVGNHGRVTAQSIPAGTSVPKETQVTLTYAK